MLIDWETAGPDERFEIEVTHVEPAICFYRDVLRAREVFRLEDSEKRPVRIGLAIGNLGFAVVSAEQASRPPATLSALADDLGYPFLAVVLRVEDPDLVRRDAIAAGSYLADPAGIGHPCIIGDPFGTHWAITNK
jgi:uncharacterized glyoxalase superfamily protein PhnB